MSDSATENVVMSVAAALGAFVLVLLLMGCAGSVESDPGISSDREAQWAKECEGALDRAQSDGARVIVDRANPACKSTDYGIEEHQMEEGDTQRIEVAGDGTQRVIAQDNDGDGEVTITIREVEE
jgi:hypothetical protein